MNTDRQLGFGYGKDTARLVNFKGASHFEVKF